MESLRRYKRPNSDVRQDFSVGLMEARRCGKRPNSHVVRDFPDGLMDSLHRSKPQASLVGFVDSPCPNNKPYREALPHYMESPYSSKSTSISMEFPSRYSPNSPSRSLKSSPLYTPNSPLRSTKSSPLCFQNSPLRSMESSPLYTPNLPSRSIESSPLYTPNSPSRSMKSSPLYTPNSPSHYSPESPSSSYTPTSPTYSHDVEEQRIGCPLRKAPKLTNNEADQEKIDDGGNQVEKGRLEKMKADNEAKIEAAMAELRSLRQKQQLIDNLLNWYLRS